MRISHLDEKPLPSAYLDPYGFNMVIDEWFSLGDLQEIAFQHPMKCKDRNLKWEDGILHWRGTKMEHDQRHPHFDESIRMSIVQAYEEVFPSTYLDFYGFKMVIGVGSSLGDLQGVAFQLPMKFKGINLIWEDGSLHGRSTKMKDGRRHP